VGVLKTFSYSFVAPFLRWKDMSPCYVSTNMRAEKGSKPRCHWKRSRRNSASRVFARHKSLEEGLLNRSENQGHQTRLPGLVLPPQRPTSSPLSIETSETQLADKGICALTLVFPSKEKQAGFTFTSIHRQGFERSSKAESRTTCNRREERRGRRHRDVLSSWGRWLLLLLQ
jgi:hypothetical protein